MTGRKSRTAAAGALAGTLACVALVGCLDVRNDAVDAGGDGCNMCHALDDISSGAHVIHQADAGLWGGIGMTCTDCHSIPSDWFVEGHLNATVEVNFADGGLATTDGAQPFFDGASCHGVYCHGGTLSGGTNRAPKWDDTTPVKCGDCHGIPPLDPHPANGECSLCHADAYVDGGLDTEVHLNGVVDLGDGDGGV